MNAILPAAGLGTRMASVTRGKPKEALPLGDSTVLGTVIREAKEAGAETISIVSSPAKPEISGVLTDLGAKLDDDVFVFMQPDPLGLSDAVMRGFTEATSLILLPDTVFLGGNASQQLVAGAEADGALLVEIVGEAEVQSYGIVEVDKAFWIQRLFEKPDPSATKSRMAIAARYLFSPTLMGFIRARVDDGDRELTSILHLAVERGFRLKAVLAEGLTRLDCGSPEGYAKAREALG